MFTSEYFAKLNTHILCIFLFIYFTKNAYQNKQSNLLFSLACETWNKWVMQPSNSKIFFPIDSTFSSTNKQRNEKIYITSYTDPYLYRYLWSSHLPTHTHTCVKPVGFDCFWSWTLKIVYKYKILPTIPVTHGIPERSLDHSAQVNNLSFKYFFRNLILFTLILSGFYTHFIPLLDSCVFCQAWKQK